MRSRSATFTLAGQPFGRLVDLTVTIRPMGRDCILEIRQHRKHGCLEVSLGELASIAIERDAKAKARGKA